MTNDTRTADEIERDIQREREEMSGTINDLQKKFSVEAIVSDIGAMFRGPSSDFGRSISQTVGRNPAAVALVGVGLAWLVLGQGRASDTTARSSRSGSRDRNDATSLGNWGRKTEANGHQDTIPLHDGDRYWFGSPGSDGEEQSNFRDRSQEEQGQDNGSAGTWRDSADGVVGAVSHAASSIRNKAADLTERLSAGTDGFSADAKARVIAARRSAHDARIASQDALKRSGRAASNLFEQQPLVVGALAIAVGAAMGGILPRSQIEDDALGANSDQMFAEAQRIFREEKDKAMAVLKAATDEVKGTLKDAGSELAEMLPDGKTAGNVISDHLADAVGRVSDTAKDEAWRQGLMAASRRDRLVDEIK